MEIVLSSTGLGLVVAGWLHYLAAIPKEKVPRRPAIHVALMGAGIAMTLYAVLRPVLGGGAVEVAVVAIAPFTIGLAAFFVYLLSYAHLPDGRLAVAVGDELVPFEAKDGEGVVRRSEEWRGKRMLLKFFRGHW